MFFEGSKLELIKKAQAAYISMLLGGPCPQPIFVTLIPFRIVGIQRPESRGDTPDSGHDRFPSGLFPPVCPEVPQRLWGYR